MLKLTILLIVLALVALGCAGTGFFSGSPTTQQLLAKIAIQQATLRAIQAEENAPERAAAVVKIVDEALVILQGSEDGVITSAELQSALDLALPKLLSPADKLLVAQLTELIVAEIHARIPAEQLDLPIAEVSTVLGWVREAAALIAPTP